MRLNQVMRRVSSWMADHGLEFATANTEVLLTKKHINTQCLMKVDDATIQTKKAIKYLKVMIDTNLTLGEQILRVADKAAAVTT